MRIGISGLQDFVGGQFAVPENPVMRGAGVGGLQDFVGGAFAIPENPLIRGTGNLLPAAVMYPIPQNSVITAWRGAGMSGVGCGSKDDCGCGCSKSGMGDLTSLTAPFTTAFTDIQTAVSMMSLTPITGQDWAVIGGTALAIYALTSMGGRRRR